ncbi:MAG: molybdopterin-dependent oxidoreductase, partial [Dehalococcoidales bacterium]|nr:molybdopterin-dependent oxidoreductase [Dehalococcoidales bacterium]
EIANPDNKKTLAEVANYQYAQYQGLIAVAAREQHNFDIVYMGRQCTFVEIEVDPETGEIIINDVCNVNDVGKAVDPDGINAQQYGGSTMGLSHNRQDGCIYDPATGVKLNNNLIDYKWFSFNDIKGPFNPNFVENGFGYGPYGYIGCSESLAAVNSTTLNLALYNAIGKWVTDNPLTPDKVLKALGKI